METPRIMIDGKEYAAQQPKTKLWRELVKYRVEYGDPQKILENPELELEAVDKLFGLMVQLLPDDITAEVLEEKTELADFARFSGLASAWVEFIIMGKAQEIPSKNVEKAGR